MSDRPKLPSVPAVPPDLPANQRGFLSAIKGALDVLVGQRGDLDRAVTFRDLQIGGLAERRGSGSYVVTPPTMDGPRVPGEVIIFPEPGPDDPPPAVTGFKASAAYASIVLTWDDPNWPVGASTFNIDQFEIFRADEEFPDPPVDSSPMTYFWGQTRALVIADLVGHGKTFYYWIRIKGKNGQVGPLAGPVSDTTAPDVEQLLEVLENSLTQDQLHQTLRTRIDQIEVLQSQINDLSGTPEYDPGETYEEDDIVKYSGALWRALQTTTGNTPVEGPYWEKIGDYASIGEAVAAHAAAIEDVETRVTVTEQGLVAEAQTRSDLAVQLRGHYTGEDINAVGSGLLHAERTARVNEDSVLSQAIEDVAARLEIGGDIYESIVQTKTIAEAKNATYMQSSTPSNPETGDLWIDTTGGQNLLKRWDGDSWEPAGDARVGAFSSQITTLQSQVRADTGIEDRLFWGFDESLDGWDGVASSNTSVAGALRHAPSASNPYFSVTFPVQSRFTGSAAPVVRARVRRVSGTGTWEGRLYYATSGHGRNEAYFKTIAAPADPSKWNVLEWDMSSLSDWNANEIRGLYIDLVTSNSPASVWDVDWVSVGSGSITPLSAALQEASSTVATLDGLVRAERTIRADINGRVTGYGFFADPNESAFAIVADRFTIAPPTGSDTGTAPFIHLATPQVVDGVLMPAGTYLRTAYIADASITNAKIGNLSADKITTGSMSAARITTGTMHADRIQANTIETRHIKAGGINADRISANRLSAITSYMGTVQSFNYSPGSAGFKLFEDGSAEFNNATVRGNITAARVMGGNYTGWGWPSSGGGFYLGPEGLMLGRWVAGQQSQYFQVEANGNIYTPGFRVINGQMVVDQANIIDTLHVRGNAITSPVHYEFSGGGSISPTNNENPQWTSPGMPVSYPNGSMGTIFIITVVCSNPNAETNCGIKVVRNGVVIFSLPTSIPGFFTTAVSVSASDGQLTGNYTYNIQLYNNYFKGGPWTPVRVSVTVLGAKR